MGFFDWSREFGEEDVGEIWKGLGGLGRLVLRGFLVLDWEVGVAFGGCFERCWFFFSKEVWF